MTMQRPSRARASSRTPSSIAANLAAVDDERREVLANLRRMIRAVVPDAVECISYGMPAFRVDGRVVAGFQATARGGSFYPFSGSTLDALGDALTDFSRTKSALHFTADRPIPAALVRKLLRARIAKWRGLERLGGVVAAESRRPPGSARGSRRCGGRSLRGGGRWLVDS